jgi:nicotinamide mononucleotide transporter
VSSILDEIVKALYATTPAEYIGAIFGLISVYLTVKRNIWCWPTGIICTVAYTYLFYDIKLYADMLLQVFFTVTSFLGWYWWLHGGEHKEELPVTYMTTPQRVWMAIGLPIACFLIGAAFRQYTDAHLPFWDATASGASVVAQILMMRKKLENWYLWIFVNILSIGIYTYKHIYLTTILYAVFLVLAFLGLIEWRKAWLKQKVDAPEPRASVPEPASSSESSSR